LTSFEWTVKDKDEVVPKQQIC